MKELFQRMQVINVVKVQLREEHLAKRLVLSMLLFTIISILLARNLVNSANLYKYEINMWDILFRIITYPYFIVLIFVPVMVAVTSVFSHKDKYMLSVCLRLCKKRTWVIANVISTLIINVLITSCLFIIVLIIGAICSRFEMNWSYTITNVNMQSKIISQLYPNGFVEEYSALAACIIQYFEIILGLTIITFIRDFLSEYFTSIKLANIITAVILFLNFVLMNFPILSKNIEFLEYLTLHNIMILWFHNFSHSSFGKLTVGQSLLSSIMLLIIILALRILMSRRLVLINDDL